MSQLINQLLSALDKNPWLTHVNDIGGVPKIRAWTAVLLIAMGTAVAQSFGRFTYGILLPAIRDDLQISNTIAGSLAAANVAAYLVGTLVVAWASSHLRLLVVFRLGLAMATLGLFAIAMAQTPPLLVIGLVLAGLGGAFVWIPAPIIAADSLPAEQRALGVALMSSGVGLGLVFSSFLSGHLRSIQGDAAWSAVYEVLGTIAVIALLGSLLLVKHRQTSPSANAGFGGFSALSRMRGWRALIFAYAVFGFTYLLVLGFLTTRLEDDSLWSSADATFAFTLMSIAMVVGGPILIGLTKRIGHRLVLGGAFLSWSILVSVVLFGWMLPTLFAVMGLGILFSGIPTVITLYVVENTSSNDYGPCYAAATLAFGVAQVASPQVGGVIADITGSFTAVFVLSAALSISGLVAALRLPSHAEY